jgi:hypothetical protein
MLVEAPLLQKIALLYYGWCALTVLAALPLVPLQEV